MKILKVLKSKVNSIVELVEIDDKQYVLKSYPSYTYSMLMEINILSTCDHRNIISIDRFHLSNSTIGMLLPKLDVSFPEIIVDSSISINSKMKYLLQIANGLRYLHYNNIAHLDIKPDNIMIHFNNAKIIDFGTACYFYQKYQYGIGTITHRAPESRIHEEHDFAKMDIWSLGIIIFEIFTGYEMYNHPITPKFNSDVFEYEYEFYSFTTSQKFQQLIQRTIPSEFHSVLDLNPSNRPNMDKIIYLLENYLENPIRLDSNLKLKISFPTKHSFNSIPAELFEYPEYLVYSLIDLAHRLSFDKFLWKSLITIANIMCCHDVSPDKNSINSMILKTNGILFQFHLFVTGGPIKFEKFVLLSKNYPEYSFRGIKDLE